MKSKQKILFTKYREECYTSNITFLHIICILCICTLSNVPELHKYLQSVYE